MRTTQTIRAALAALAMVLGGCSGGEDEATTATKHGARLAKVSGVLTVPGPGKYTVFAIVGGNHGKRYAADIERMRI